MAAGLHEFGQALPKLITFCFPRFSPPISQFTNKISPVCLPQPGDDSRLPIGAYCYVTGKFSPLYYDINVNYYWLQRSPYFLVVQIQ